MSKIMAASLDMSGNAITNVADGVAITDAATVGQLPSTSVLVPYTGANANVDIGAYDLTADLISATRNVYAGTTASTSARFDVTGSSTVSAFTELNFDTATHVAQTCLINFNESYSLYANNFTMWHSGYHFYLNTSGLFQLGGTIAQQNANIYRLQVVGDINSTTGLREAGTLLSAKYAPITHSHSYLALDGSTTMTGDLKINQYIKRNANTHGVWLYDNGTSIVYPTGVSGEFTIQSGTLGGANTTRFKVDDTGAYLPQVSGMNASKIMSMDATTGVVEIGSLVASDVGAAASNHTHGNISNAGAVGGTQYLPIITGAGGVLVTGEFSNAANTFAEGNHLHTGVYQPAGSYQPLDATLTAIAGTAPVANQMIHFTGADVATTVATGSVGLSVLASTTTALARTAIACPPTSHASTGTSYGESTATNYGHAKAATGVTNNPLMDGTAAVGTTTAIFAMSDHVHPTDTSRAAQASLANYLPLAGGSMTGGVVMGSNPITDASGVSGNTTGNDWSLGGGALSLKAGSGAILPILLQPVTGSFGSEPKLSWRGSGGGDQSVRGNPTGIECTGAVTCTNSITDKVSPSTTIANTPSVEFGLVYGSVGAMKIKNDIGEVRISQASAAYAYYETNATYHYFNKPLEVYSNVAINSPTVTITPASGMTTTSMSAYKGCDKTLIVGGIITKSSNFVAGDTLFTLASGGYPPFTTYVTVATSATAVVTLTISTAGVVTLSTIHHGSVGAGMTLSFQTIRS